MHNMLSVTQKPKIAKEYLVKECVESRVLDPLDPLQLLIIQISCFGVISKGSSEKWYLIMDLLSHEGHSVNDVIDGDLF